MIELSTSLKSESKVGTTERNCAELGTIFTSSKFDETYAYSYK